MLVSHPSLCSHITTWQHSLCRRLCCLHPTIERERESPASPKRKQRKKYGHMLIDLLSFISTTASLHSPAFFLYPWLFLSSTPSPGHAETSTRLSGSRCVLDYQIESHFQSGVIINKLIPKINTGLSMNMTFLSFLNSSLRYSDVLHQAPIFRSCRTIQIPTLLRNG